MDYNTKPDYEKCRKILTSGVETAGGSLTGPLNLSQKPQTPKRKSTGADKEVTPQKKSRVKKIKKIKENDNSSDDEQENIEKNKKTETPIRRGRSKKEKEVEIISNSESEDEHNGFTAEMMRVKKKMEDKKKTKIKSKKVLTAH